MVSVSVSSAQKEGGAHIPKRGSWDILARSRPIPAMRSKNSARNGERPRLNNTTTTDAQQLDRYGHGISLRIYNGE